MLLSIHLLLGIVTSAFMASAQNKGLDSVYSSEAHNFRIEVLTQQQDVVWGFDFLKDGRLIFTERRGAIKIFNPKTKAISEIKGVPKVWSKGQGGLLDIRVQPAEGSKIYFTYSEPVGSGATTALASALLSDGQLTKLQKLFAAHEANSNDIHFGSRIEFDKAGYLFVTVGDRNERAHAQDLAYHTGKIIRLNQDGSVPSDNPFAQQKGARAEVWTLGHRSPQGLVRHPVTNELWMAEMGPRGGDEINWVKAGLNYGWPIVTYGREYWGPKIGEGTAKSGMEAPIAHWVPSISPSGIAFYTADRFPKWKDNLFIGTLSGTHLRRLVLQDKKVTHQEELLKDLGWRFRNVRMGPDGFLYFSTDDGKIARLVP